MSESIEPGKRYLVSSRHYDPTLAGKIVTAVTGSPQGNYNNSMVDVKLFYRAYVDKSDLTEVADP